MHVNKAGHWLMAFGVLRIVGGCNAKLSLEPGAGGAGNAGNND
jgi:hypothetical protein